MSGPSVPVAYADALPREVTRLELYARAWRRGLNLWGWGLGILLVSFFGMQVLTIGSDVLFLVGALHLRSTGSAAYCVLVASATLLGLEAFRFAAGSPLPTVAFLVGVASAVAFSILIGGQVFASRSMARLRDARVPAGELRPELWFIVSMLVVFLACTTWIRVATLVPRVPPLPALVQILLVLGIAVVIIMTMVIVMNSRPLVPSRVKPGLDARGQLI